MIEKLKQAIFEGDVNATPKITEEALNANIAAEVLREEAISKPLAEIEEKIYGNSKVWGHPQVFMGYEAARRSLEVLQPRIKPTTKPVGTMVLGAPQGEIHTIGTKMVYLAHIAAGFEVFYLGSDVPATKFIHKVHERQADILGISCYTTDPWPQLEKIVELLKAEKMKHMVHVMIGGVTPNKKFADKLGVKYANTASNAVKISKECMGEKIWLR